MKTNNPQIFIDQFISPSSTSIYVALIQFPASFPVSLEDLSSSSLPPLFELLPLAIYALSLRLVASFFRFALSPPYLLPPEQCPVVTVLVLLIINHQSSIINHQHLPRGFSSSWKGSSPFFDREGKPRLFIPDKSPRESSNTKSSNSKGSGASDLPFPGTVAFWSADNSISKSD